MSRKLVPKYLAGTNGSNNNLSTTLYTCPADAVGEVNLEFLTGSAGVNYFTVNLKAGAVGAAGGTGGTNAATAVNVTDKKFFIHPGESLVLTTSTNTNPWALSWAVRLLIVEEKLI